MADALVRLASIVGVDVAGYSARTERDPAVSTREVLALRERLGAIAMRHGGRIFNTAGDSIMMEFAAAGEAVSAIFELLDERAEGRAGDPHRRASRRCFRLPKTAISWVTASMSQPA